MTPDRMLVGAVLAGEEGAFARLVELHQPLCWHIAYRLTGDREAARDVCQDALLRVHQNLPRFRFDSALRTWIGRIAWSVAVRYLERRRINLVDAVGGAEGEALFLAQPADELVEHAANANQLHDLVRRELEQLPPVQRMLISLYHLDEVGIPEISRMTGMPAGTIKVYLARARLQMRQRLEPLLGD